MNLPDAPAEIARLVETSLSRNAALAVRGALVFTEGHFAQVLEGPAEGVEALMESIGRDPRHDHVTTVETIPIDRYRFADWALAYWGNAVFMDHQVATVLDQEDMDKRAAETARLYKLIRQLARESDGHGPIGKRSRG